MNHCMHTKSLATLYFEKLDGLSWGAGVIVVVSIFIAFAIAGLFLVRKLASYKSLRAHHDVTGYIFANIGVLYAVLLGFTVVNVQQRFDKIKETTQIEASYLAEMFSDAAVFPEKERDRIRKTIIEYSESVMTQEWSMMAEGTESPHTAGTLKALMQSYYDLTPADNTQLSWYNESINKLNLLIQARLGRLMGTEESLGQEMWTLLISGGLVIIAFVWFFSIDNIYSHMIMASLMAASIAFLLFLIYSLDTAFTGQILIPPKSFEHIHHTFLLQSK